MKSLMVYREEYHPKIKSDLKNIDKQVVKKIRDTHLNKILASPYGNPTLKGNLSNIYSYHFRENKVDYRIAYSIEKECIIFYYMVAKRENFYEKIKNRV